METLQQLWKKYRTFVLYCMIGFTGATLDFILFFIMFNYMKVPALIASPISMIVGITNNFFFNAFFNFKTRDRLHYRYATFLAVGILGIGIADVFIFLVHNIGGIDANIAKALSIVLIAIIQYFLNKRISFTSTNNNGK